MAGVSRRTGASAAATWLMVGAVILWVVLRICWALAWGYAANGPRVVERPALTLMVVPASGRIRPS
jgi:hypothetical protein